VVGTAKGIPALECLECGEYPPVKSNACIHSELQRMLSGIPIPQDPCCPNSACENYAVCITAGKQYYSLFGKTSAGSPRYKCKACCKVFAVKKSTSGQRLPHKNKLIFSLLMNKSPFNRICEVACINPKTLYDKIDFIHQQCLAFSGDRERKLLEDKPIRRLYVSVDRQDYMVNWTRRADKRNTQLTAVGSADNTTGYVFGMHLNYEPSLDIREVEAEAVAAGDYSTPHPFRRHARLWLNGDYDEAIHRSFTQLESCGLNEQIEDTYSDAVQRLDVESSERTDSTRKLPSKGVQVHAEYTLYGHFFFLHRLFGGAEKVRFFLDQDSGMRAACLAAFQPEIKGRTCDAFYVRINTAMTVDEKRRALADSRSTFQNIQREQASLTDNEVRLLIIKQHMTSVAEIGQWKDHWLSHPFPNMSEPEKAVCYLTNYGDYDEDHLAWLYNKASIHGVDRFFMQVRRRLSLLERPIASASNARRMWYGYSPYNPTMIKKMLDIFRVYYNFCLAGKDQKTPAARLGLASGKATLEDIIYFL